MADFDVTFVTAVCLQYNLIVCSHGNIGGFTGLNDHCSWADEMQQWALTGRYFWSVGPLVFVTCGFEMAVNRPVYRLVGPLLYLIGSASLVKCTFYSTLVTNGIRDASRCLVDSIYAYLSDSQLW